ncbi:MAG TPA: 4Fe-4S binding protein [Spirochaetota bacterium]|nr:4Fe-4S binding protein [Spirochaetota bacterium]
MIKKLVMDQPGSAGAQARNRTMPEAVNMKQSTKDIFKKHGWRVDRAIHNIIYFRYYYPYIKVLTTGVLALRNMMWFKPLRPVANFVFHRYHAKTLSTGDTRKIFTLNEDVRRISDENKRIVPFKYATKIIFQEPEFIAVMDCPCKKSTGAPKEDLNSCFMIGRAAQFWLDNNKYNARKVTQEEALGIIDRLRKKNYITQAFFKVATGGSTGVICNCHPDYCLNIIASNITKKLGTGVVPVAMHSGYSVRHDPAKCKNCGTCAQICPFEAIVMKDGNRVYIKEECRGCELCSDRCPSGALSLFVDASKPEPLDMDKVKAGLAN